MDKENDKPVPKKQADNKPVKQQRYTFDSKKEPLDIDPDLDLDFEKLIDF